MAKIDKSIEVGVPLSTAYNQWTQFEEFPKFMEGVEYVKQLDDTQLHWKAEIGGVTREWKAEITEQRPDEMIAWQSIDGPLNTGVVTFEALGPDMTRVMLEIEYEPEGATENVGTGLGLVAARVEGDLERFRDFIEERGHETGAWRGQVAS
jgi:uncharacterized membrane protein